MVLLLLAVAWHLQAKPDAVVVSTGDDARVAASFRRLLFALSGGLQLGSLVSASRSLKLAPKPSVVALALSASWLALVVWTLLQ